MSRPDPQIGSASQPAPFQVCLLKRPNTSLEDGEVTRLHIWTLGTRRRPSNELYDLICFQLTLINNLSIK